MQKRPYLRIFTLFISLLATLSTLPVMALEGDNITNEANSEKNANSNEAFSAEEKSLLNEASKISTQVEQIRELNILRPIKKGIKKRDELRDRIKEMLAADVPIQSIKAEGNYYKILGLIPQSLDYYKTLLDLLAAEIAGFYDPAHKELYVMAGLPPQLQAPAMAHEIFHAIQDQHYNIEHFERPFNNLEYSDVAIARSALLEGDATAVMIDYALYNAGQLPTATFKTFADAPLVVPMLYASDLNQLLNLESILSSGVSVSTPEIQSSFKNIPEAMTKILIFPYIAGLRFVGTLRRGHKWEEVNKVYTNPPLSTEQIIHPAKYLKHEEPIQVTYNLAPLFAKKGWKPIYQTVMGEFITMLFLQQNLPDWSPPTATLTKTPPKRSTGNHPTFIDASEGWGGDRVVVYQKGDKSFLISVSSWDSTRDAQEFFTTAKEILQRRYRYDGGKEANESGKYGEYYQVGGKESRGFVERWGDVVLLALDMPLTIDFPTNCAIRTQVWSTLARRVGYSLSAKKTTQ